jgi:hypothetical protein
MKKNQFLIIGVLICSLLIFSCKKIKRSYLLKGKWEIENFTINGGEENMIAAFFTDHKAGKGKMVMNFSDDGVFKADHYSFGKIDSTIYGTWSMPEHNITTVKMSNLVDAIFQVEIVDTKNVLLHTESNFIGFYDIGYVTSIIELTAVEN